MKKLCGLLLGCCLLYSALQLGECIGRRRTPWPRPRPRPHRAGPVADCPETCDCHKKCKDVNEVYNECGTACPDTCENYGIPRSCTRQCVAGCFCKDGFVRDKRNRCIPPELCEDKCTGMNEEYTCGTACPVTCENYGKRPESCTAQCIFGCYCKEGFVRDRKKGCIPPQYCNGRGCAEDEEYYQLIPDCTNTCENYNKTNVNCPMDMGSSGCFCKEGLVKRKDGKCVPFEECQCGEDEQYYDEIPDCMNTCENFNNPDAMCPLIISPPGCFCREGLVMRKDGKCVPFEECGECPPECGPNEQYYQCMPDCTNKCETYGKKVNCPMICKSGCFCKPGLVKREDGQCVEPCDCNTSGECGPLEQYYECTPDCHNKCETYGKPIACTAICHMGCFCKPGLVLRKDGQCVDPAQCTPPGECRINEEYSTCGTCPATCEDQNPICTTQKCRVGCFCKEDYVLNEKGICIHKKLCPTEPPPEQCGPLEQYYDCTPDCGNTCETYGKNLPCPMICHMGCFCIPGLVKRQDGQCVPPSQCFPPAEWCGPNAYYSNCASLCPPTCSQRHKYCAAVCVKGCTCYTGYILNVNDGICIPEEMCPKDPIKDCGPNAHYSDCASPCPPNCWDRRRACAEVCVEGCKCNPGFILLGGNGILCIPEDMCPKNPYCPPNMEYSSCGPKCPPTCNNRNPYCDEQCTQGCFCRKGFILDYNDGKCIPESQCPECVIPNCGIACFIDYNAKPCPGCICDIFPPQCDIPKCDDPGCEINYNADPCPTCECDGPPGGIQCDPPQCDPPCVIDYNSKPCPGCNCPIVDPGIQCDPPQCDPPCEMNYTTKPCPSCDCPPIHPILCLNPDERYYECKPPSCTSTCECYFKHCFCTHICAPGCYCKEGLVKTDDDKCVPPQECPNAPQCGINEEFSRCGTCRATCDNRHPMCTKECKMGCFCKKGFVLNVEGGICIPEEICPGGPGPQSCGINEEFSTCGSCRPTCDNRHPFCTKECKVGCFCKKGYILNADGGICIPEKLCPDVCGPNEEYSICASRCNDCATRGNCESFACSKGCDCKPGFRRREPGGLCIPESECPVEYCGPHASYSDCAPLCPRTCPPWKAIACDPCVNGCVCDPGYILEKDGGMCIPEDQCPPLQCPKNEEYQKCGTACPLTCKYPNPRFCPQSDCVSACFCKEGLVRADDGSCIPPKKCKKKCGKDERYYKHKPECPNTCEVYPYRDVVLCKRGEPGCFCKEGLVKRKDGKCVRPEQCDQKIFCPAKPNIFCYEEKNECCGLTDCPVGQLCCHENCGNKCKDPVKKETNGEMVVYDPKCVITEPDSGTQEIFCPERDPEVCVVHQDLCCGLNDCAIGQLCCVENCGNDCREPVNYKTNGTMVVYDPNCVIGQ